MYAVYILFSKKLNKYYIGYTSNLESRLAYHNNSVINKIWTKRGIPWEIFFQIDGMSEVQALRVEKHIKKMKSTKYIDNLKQYPDMVQKLKKKYA